MEYLDINQVFLETVLWHPHTIWVVVVEQLYAMHKGGQIICNEIGQQRLQIHL